MSSPPRLNRFLFLAFILISLCVGGSALVWPSFRSIAYAPLRDSLLPNFYLNPQAGRPVSIVMAVSPALENWARDSMAEFSKQNPLITVEVTVLRGAEANRRLNVMTGLPDIWIAESDWVRTAAGGIPYEETGTVVAQDSFLWALSKGSPQNVLSHLDWTTFARLADSDPAFRMALPPEGSIEGMGACLSAAAEYFGQPSLTAAQIGDPSFRQWLDGLLDAVPDLADNPFDTMASRPPQADVAFLPIRDGRRLDPSAFSFQAPQYAPVLNFTLFIRSGWNELPDADVPLKRGAVDTIQSYLAGGGPQGKLAEYFLERSDASFNNSIRPADASAVYALQFCWQHQGGNS
jgi:hypothetical protein